MITDKKGALQLSINAIVVLILAITILGLGLGFIKSQFGALEQQFQDVSAEIKSELIDKIQNSGELLAFNKVELTAKIGKPESFFIGIKNTAANEVGDPEEPVCFTIEIRCKQGLVNECTEFGNNVLVGGLEEGLLSGDEAVERWFTVFESIDIDPGQVGVLPVNVQIAGAKPDTYLMDFRVHRYTGSCDNPGSKIDKPYQTKQFFVRLS